MKACPRAAGVAVMVIVLALAGCEESAIPQGMRIIDGNPERGALLIREYGCPTCHTIPGIRSANGIVGPPLDRFALRAFIAGRHANTPDNLVHWIMDAPDMAPHTAMPDMGISEDQARHIAAYLYTLR
ncbi:c-type cytochrome [Nitratireductor thuwali]|uniref:Cytochrome c oxidase subunit 2 n=1 Tax=Nitratireductor thuwali TaxID=2267699 RepID=A0ABY5MH37_9HYPH|nr:Cytochrome c oxidase subunit 2 [Nitratireductor thuwali]